MGGWIPFAGFFATYTRSGWLRIEGPHVHIASNIVRPPALLGEEIRHTIHGSFRSR